MLQKNYLYFFLFTIMQLSIDILFAQQIKDIGTVAVGNGWAGNSVNTVVFRKNSLCTYKNTQYISYYNNDGFVVIGKRKLNTADWELQTTNFKGNVSDAHNAISIIIDGAGYLHLSWNQHNNSLHYSRSIAPGSLQMLEELPMTGIAEQNVTYPEFYIFPGGNLLFLYRDGRSGKGNLVINRYDIKTKKWEQLHKNLIDGEGQRNAYWQAYVDAKGTVHLSWVWRETADVATNHDLCYARSADGGLTWQNSKNENYALPINAATAEYVCRIPQKSELINQTSMCADEIGNPFIGSYWREQGDSVPQYHIAYKTGKEWQLSNLGFRKTAFSLSGAGTKRIPVSRPQVVSFKNGKTKIVALIFRDEERDNKVSVAVNKNIGLNNWQLTDITDNSVGSWEPTYDTELWKQKKQISLFVQFTDQKDAEGKAAIKPQMIKVITFKM